MLGRPSEGALAVAAKIARLKRQGQPTKNRHNHARETMGSGQAARRFARALRDKRAFSVAEELSGAMSYGIYLGRDESMIFRAAAEKAA